MESPRGARLGLVVLLALLLGAIPRPGPAGAQAPLQALADELHRVLDASGLEAALRRLEEIRREPASGYDLGEAQLNRLGYRLLEQDRREEALAFLRRNVELFPDSANARDSLAEAYLWADRPDAAADAYEAVLAVLARRDEPLSGAEQYLASRAREALAAHAAASAEGAPPANAPVISAAPRSPRLRRLLAEVAERGPAAVDSFVDEVQRTGAPLVEPLDEGAEPGRFLVTFLWLADRDDPGAIVVESPFEGRYPERRIMERLAGTRLWFKSFEAPPGLRAGYLLSPNDRRFGRHAAMFTDSLIERGWRRDPWNPRHERGEGNRHWSLLALPGAPAAPWLDDEPVPPETLHELALPDADLGGERRVVVYAPPARPPGDGSPLVVFLDGFAMHEIERGERMLARLARDGALPPVAAAFVYSPESRRNRELSCQEPMQRFLADTLLPILRERFAAGRSPERTVLVGRSRSGLGAVCAALARPEAFGKAIAQSGAFWWAPEGEETEWLARQVAAGERRPIEVELQAGSLEASPNPSTGLGMLTVSRHLRDVLHAKGYRLHWTEFPGGHDPTAWRAVLPDALVRLLAPGELASPR